MRVTSPSPGLALRAFFGGALNLGGAAGILEGDGPSPILPVEGGPPTGLRPEDLQKDLLLSIAIPIHPGEEARSTLSLVSDPPVPGESPVETGSQGFAQDQERVGIVGGRSNPHLVPEEEAGNNGSRLAIRELEHLEVLPDVPKKRGAIEPSIG